MYSYIYLHCYVGNSEWLCLRRCRLATISQLTHHWVSQSYVTTDSQSASLSWNKAPLWGLRPDLYYCLTVAGLLFWGALSDERTGLSFTMAAGPRQRSHFYCLRLETSLFVASYDSQGHGGGIRPRLHTGAWILLCRFDTDRIENSSNSSLVVAGRCLAIARLLIEPLPSSGRSFGYHVTVL
jgi:hypothetical protein